MTCTVVMLVCLVLDFESRIRARPRGSSSHLYLSCVMNFDIIGDRRFLLSNYPFEALELLQVDPFLLISQTAESSRSQLVGPLIRLVQRGKLYLVAKAPPKLWCAQYRDRKVISDPIRVVKIACLSCHRKRKRRSDCHDEVEVGHWYLGRPLCHRIN